jgi:ribosomal protein L40E
VLQAGRGLILITGSDRELREALAHSLIMECNPQRRKVVALFVEENMMAGLESYVTVSAEETNRAVAELRGVSADAVYIEDIRREGLQLGGLLQLAETTTVIASISVPAAKEAVAFIERRTPELAPSDRGLLMVVETLKNEIPCAACSPATLGVRGKGCRKCGYAGFTGHLQKIHCISY